MKKQILLAVPLLVITTACVVFGINFDFTAARTPVVKSQTPTATSTSTPPVKSATPNPPTNTPTSTATSTSTFTPTTTSTATITLTPELPGFRFPETPVPVPESSYPEDQVRILLMGVDSKDSIAFRTDTILLLTLNPQPGTASLLSIPPMLYVNIPEIGMERINSAIAFGGAGKVIDTVQYNLGIRSSKYLLLDFQNFTKILSSFSPIDVQVGAQLIDRCDLPQAVEGWCAVEPGLRQMDQNTALWYVRDRAGGEFERMRRGQEVLLGVFNHLMSDQAPARMDELYAAYYDSVETDLTIDDLVNLTPMAITVFTNGQIKKLSFSTVEAVPAILPGGENVLLLDQNAAWRLIKQAVFQP